MIVFYAENPDKTEFCRIAWQYSQAVMAWRTLVSWGLTY